MGSRGLFVSQKTLRIEGLRCLDAWGHNVDIGGNGPPPLLPSMRPDYATPADFAKWEAHAKTLDLYALRYTIEDCQQAAKNMRGFNAVREGFYSDQASTYGMEYTRRTRQS